MKSRMTPRRLSRFDWLMMQIVRIGKFFVVGLAVLWFVLWIGAGGFLDKAEDKVQAGVADIAARMGLRVSDVIVEGRYYLPAQALKDAVGVKPGDPLLGVDLQKLHENLQKNPWVKDVSIRRALPDRLVITLTERKPLAIWLDAPGMPGIVDDEGVILTQSGFENFGPLIAVTGEESEKHASEIIALLKGQPDIAVRISRAIYVSERRWDLVATDGTLVKLPEDDAGLALARLAKAQGESKILDQGLKSVDLRQVDRIILESKPGDIRDLLLKDAPPV